MHRMCYLTSLCVPIFPRLPTCLDYTLPLTYGTYREPVFAKSSLLVYMTRQFVAQNNLALLSSLGHEITLRPSRA